MDQLIVNYKSWFLLLLLPLCSATLSAQLTLEEAINQARTNSNLSTLKQIAIAEKDLEIKNIKTTNRPNLSVMAQATYQSEVTSLDIPIPNLEIDPLSKDQYKIQAEISQNIYDGGMGNQRKKIQNTSSELAQLGAELAFEKMRERIITIYFSVLEMDGLIQQLDLKKSDLAAREKVIQAAVENGTVLKMEQQSLQAAMLLLGQEVLSLNAKRQSQLDILALLIETDLPEGIQLESPTGFSEDFRANTQSYRHQFFQLQQMALDQKEELTTAVNRPKIGAFVQGGYGKPGLNFLKNEFSPYYILGARVQWNLNGLYTQSNDSEIQKLNKQKIAIEEQNYEQQISTQEAQYQAEITRLSALLSTDEELLSLRQKIKNTAQVQFDNGVMIAADYLQRLNEENQARQNKKIHEIQLIKNQYLLQHITSNYSTR